MRTNALKGVQRTYVERRYDDTLRQIAAHRGDNDPVAWVDRNAEQVRFLRALQEELAVRGRRAEYQLVRAAQTDPPEPSRTIRTGATPAAGRPRPGTPCRHPHRRDDGAPSIRELLGLRWRDVDWSAQRIRVRNTWVRGEHSTDGKSDLSTSRSVPMADRLLAALDAWSTRTIYNGDEHLVFAHPQTGNPLDGSKVTKRFQAACRDAGVRRIRFHDLRHTFATQLAASGKVSLRTLQEFLGHADAKTTQIYAHYAPSTHEVEMVNAAFAAELEEASDTAPD